MKDCAASGSFYKLFVTDNSFVLDINPKGYQSAYFFQKMSSSLDRVIFRKHARDNLVLNFILLLQFTKF